jgi:glycosyltransferase involved in cell wall biosynthesis
MSVEPVASVIVPFYNQAGYVVECLESIARQKTSFPFEILAGDDASPDHTRAVIQDCQKRFPGLIQLVAADKNSGLVANVERCEALARGKYIAYCGGDDIWSHPSKLQKQVDFLEQHPDFGLVYSNFYRLVEGKIEGTCFEKTGEAAPAGQVFEVFLMRNFIGALTACWRGELMRSFPESPFAVPCVVEDYPRWLHASRASLVGYIDEPLATYRILKTSMSNNLRKRLALDNSVWDMKLEGVRRLGISGPIVERMLKLRNLILLRFALFAGDRATFLREYREMKVYNPEWNVPWHNKARSWLMFAGFTRLVQYAQRKAGLE